jgi:hypothetical protein
MINVSLLLPILFRAILCDAPSFSTSFYSINNNNMYKNLYFAGIVRVRPARSCLGVSNIIIAIFFWFSNERFHASSFQTHDYFKTTHLNHSCPSANASPSASASYSLTSTLDGTSGISKNPQIGPF